MKYSFKTKSAIDSEYPGPKSHGSRIPPDVVGQFETYELIPYFHEEEALEVDIDQKSSTKTPNYGLLNSIVSHPLVVFASDIHEWHQKRHRKDGERDPATPAAESEVGRDAEEAERFLKFLESKKRRSTVPILNGTGHMTATR